MLFYLYRERIIGGGVALLALVAVLFLSCGKEPVKPPDVWVLLDLSGSTVKARDDYSAAFRSLARKQSLLKDGTIQLLPVAGDPSSDALVRPIEVGVDTDNPSTASIQRSLKVLTAARVFDDLLLNPPPHKRGSALVEALWLVAGKVKPGDTISVFSDGLQDSDLLILRRADISGPLQRQQRIDEIQRAGYIADMFEVPVDFVLPGGVVTVTNPTEVTAFWKAWAGRVQANLDY